MREVSYSKFEDLVKSGSVERVRVFTSRNTLEARITPEAAKELFGDSGTGSPMGDGNRSIVVSIPSVEVVTDFMQQARGAARLHRRGGLQGGTQLLRDVPLQLPAHPAAHSSSLYI